jgi:thiol:disulfide interchange protein
VISRTPAQEALKDFVFAELYTDKDPRNRDIQDQRFGTVALPLYVILGPDGRERVRLAGRITESQFLEFLKKGLDGSTSPANGGER